MQAYRSQQVQPMSEEEVTYLSSGEVGQSNIVLLAKKVKSSDTRATRSTDCGSMFKYHASSCCGLSRSARSLTSIRDRLNVKQSGKTASLAVDYQNSE